MKHICSAILLCSVALLMFVGCQQEDIQVPDELDAKGRIVLSLTDIEVYVDAPTRATQTLGAEDEGFSNFVFTLERKTGEDWETVSGVTFTNGSAVVEAGTYRVTASNLTASQTGKGCPYYSGSAEVEVQVGQVSYVSIGNEANPLKPQNAKLTLALDGTFTALYDTPTVILNPDGRNLTLTTATNDAVYFPAGDVSYKVTANALSGSHVTDIVSATGTLSVSGGTHYTITLTASPVTGTIIPVVSGEHSAEFD